MKIQNSTVNTTVMLRRKDTMQSISETKSAVAGWKFSESLTV